jgi:hypothetical protein
MLLYGILRYWILIPLITIAIAMAMPIVLPDPSLEDPYAIYDDFPSIIIDFQRRIDVYSNQSVQRGRFEYIGGWRAGRSTNSTPLTLMDFRRTLQCAPTEPTLEGNRGSFSFLQLIPPTRETIELLIVRAHTYCYPWKACQCELERWRQQALIGNLTPKACPQPVDWNNHLRLIRIRNNSLYYENPFFRCISSRQSDWQYYPHFLVLDKLVDMKDSLFFQAEENPTSTSKFPFPILSNGPGLQTMDIPYVWLVEQRLESQLYDRNFPRSHDDYAASSPKYGYYRKGAFHSYSYSDWKIRIPKAAYFSSLGNNRMIIFDMQTARPDLIDARWIGKELFFDPIPSDPFSPEDDFGISDVTKFYQEPETKLGGGLRSMMKYHINGSFPYLKRRYKYIIVISGYENQGLSGRLNHLLAHSGAVILLQTTDMEYHYSARLKPWVHYVPISFNAADVIRKVEWLRQHDEFAYQLAKNAKAFGDSYLRLEDYFCYIAALQEQLGQIFESSDGQSNIFESFDLEAMDFTDKSSQFRN